jgi:hypothetical protein
MLTPAIALRHRLTSNANFECYFLADLHYPVRPDPDNRPI